MKGIDVSVHNGDIDFAKAKEDGVEFVIIRAGYGSAPNQVDKCLEQNYSRAKAAGLHIGFYWYCYGDCIQDAINETRYFLEAIKGKEHDFPVYLDLEEKSQLSQGKDFCSAYAKAFIGSMEKAGHTCGLYISRFYLQSVIDDEIKSKYPIWVAEYAEKLHYTGEYGIWQYSSAGTVKGVEGHCDMNIAYQDYSLKLVKNENKKEDQESMSRLSAYNQMKKEVLGKSFDVDGYYGPQCFAAGTFITMENGTYKPVEDVRLGEILKGGNRVITNFPKSSKLLQVRTDAGVMKVTPDHKFILADHSQVPASRLKPGDQILLDTEAAEDATTLDESELKTLGYYLAKGWKESPSGSSPITSVYFSAETEKQQEFVNGLPIHVYERISKKSGIKALMLQNSEHKELIDLISKLDGKKLSQNFSPREFSNIIEGYLAGAGKKKGANTIVVSDTPELLLALQHGCLVNGWKAVFTGPERKAADEENFLARPVYRLVVNQKSHSAGKVTAVSEVKDEDTVYVLNLSGDHLYYGNNHLSHNCWDFAVYCMKHYFGGKIIHCGLTGYAKDIANQKKTNGILDFCTDIGLKTELQPGDICVWGNCTAAPSSHIALYDHDNGSSEVYFLGQNQGSNPKVVTVTKVPISGIIGVFRPKKIAGEDKTAAKTTANPTEVLNSIPSDFVRESARFTCTVASLKIREAPSLAGKDTGIRYIKNQSVHYDGYVRREGYVWISWIGKSGTRRWMAAGELNSAGRNVKPYGTFK